jgi:hypothetical protein
MTRHPVSIVMLDGLGLTEGKLIVAFPDGTAGRPSIDSTDHDVPKRSRRCAEAEYQLAASAAAAMAATTTMTATRAIRSRVDNFHLNLGSTLQVAVWLDGLEYLATPVGLARLSP